MLKTAAKRKIMKVLMPYIIPVALILIGLFFLLVLVVGMLAGNDQSSQQIGDGTVVNVNLSETTLQWLDIVIRECNEQGVPELVPWVMAIIEVESRGLVPDVMQSSESLGLPPNTLNAEQSIRQGVAYLRSAILLAQSLGIDDIWASIQSYNFGHSYLRWLANQGRTHSTDAAYIFSRDVVAPSLGNTTGRTYPYINAVSVADGRTYLFWNGGNFHYSALVGQFVVQGGGSGYFIWPTPGYTRVSSPFGPRPSPGGIGSTNHGGIDIAAPMGARIVASASGTVTASGWNGGFGNMIIIDHGDGYRTLYAHNSQNHVTVGQHVTQGQVIGLVGSTGNSTGPHLHFEIHRNGVRVDPLIYVSP